MNKGLQERFPGDERESVAPTTAAAAAAAVTNDDDEIEETEFEESQKVSAVTATTTAAATATAAASAAPSKDGGASSSSSNASTNEREKEVDRSTVAAISDTAKLGEDEDESEEENPNRAADVLQDVLQYKDGGTTHIQSSTYKIGTRICKEWCGTYFAGKIVLFDSEEKFYKVRYEDGDEEEMEEHEVTQHLSDDRSPLIASKRKFRADEEAASFRRPKTTPSKRPKKTPATNSTTTKKKVIKPKQKTSSKRPKKTPATNSTTKKKKVIKPKQKSPDQDWDMMFDELVAYKEQHGHTDVPARDGSLGKWVKNHRHECKLHFLPLKHRDIENETSLDKRTLDRYRYRIDRFDSIGFTWYPHGNKWKMKFAELEAFVKDVERNGDTKMPKSLRNWFNDQPRRATGDRKRKFELLASRLQNAKLGSRRPRLNRGNHEPATATATTTAEDPSTIFEFGAASATAATDRNGPPAAEETAGTRTSSITNDDDLLIGTRTAAAANTADGNTTVHATASDGDDDEEGFILNPFEREGDEESDGGTRHGAATTPADRNTNGPTTDVPPQDEAAVTGVPKAEAAVPHREHRQQVEALEDDALQNPNKAPARDDDGRGGQREPLQRGLPGHEEEKEDDEEDDDDDDEGGHSREHNEDGFHVAMDSEGENDGRQRTTDDANTSGPTTDVPPEDEDGAAVAATTNIPPGDEDGAAARKIDDTIASVSVLESRIAAGGMDDYTNKSVSVLESRIAAGGMDDYTNKLFQELLKRVSTLEDAFKSQMTSSHNVPPGEADGAAASVTHNMSSAGTSCPPTSAANTTNAAVPPGDAVVTQNSSAATFPREHREQVEALEEDELQNSTVTTPAHRNTTSGTAASAAVLLVNKVAHPGGQPTVAAEVDETYGTRTALLQGLDGDDDDDADDGDDHKKPAAVNVTQDAAAAPGRRNGTVIGGHFSETETKVLLAATSLYGYGNWCLVAAELGRMVNQPEGQFKDGKKQKWFTVMQIKEKVYELIKEGTIELKENSRGGKEIIVPATLQTSLKVPRVDWEKDFSSSDESTDDDYFYFRHHRGSKARRRGSKASRAARRHRRKASRGEDFTASNDYDDDGHRRKASRGEDFTASNDYDDDYPRGRGRRTSYMC